MKVGKEKSIVYSFRK